MRFLIGLIAGLVAGRFSGWVGWRQRQEELDAELAALRADRTAAWQAVQAVEAERNKLEAQLKLLTQQPQATRAIEAVALPRNDDLRVIRGIGQVFAQRLADAGVTSFGALAARDPEELRSIVGAQAWQDVDTQSWIDEARELAQGGV